MQPLDTNDPVDLGSGRYKLEGILGEGSMGRTYLAQCDEGPVAVKALYPSRLATVKDLELFVREAEVLKRLSHPRIPSYIDAFDEGEGEAIRYHLVQQYVEGQTLREVIARGDRYDDQMVGGLLKSLLAVLAYMHACDPPVVHRDIKPDNIILRSADDAPVLVDFGAVREVVRLTMGGGSTIIGTYGYMPPEQLMGRALPASDIYSVGITALEMLTRQTPQDLHGADVKRLIDGANVSEELRRVLRRMCAPSLADRYETADQVLGDLEAALGGGALVHAGSIEQSIQKRVKDEERALKRASSPGIVHVGYLALIGSLVVAAVIGISVLANMVAASFEGVFVAAGLVSGFGMFVTLLLLGNRYTHDAWEPPSAAWTRTTGEVTSHSNVYMAEEGLLANTVYQIRIHYGFRTKRGDHEATFDVPKNEADKYPVGKTFVAYYQQSNPQWHELQSIAHDPDDVMQRLFSSANKHTPE